MSGISTRLGWFLGVAISVSSANSAHAQITPDGTLPNNSTVTQQGNTSTITGGTKAGSNLFHSFREFSVPTNGTAFFNNALDIQNIISRVTGKSISNIDGLIRANGAANLFLINPNGIIFGPNARLDIGGSFVGSTASSLKFADGFEFSATNPQSTPLLTINVPIGLQYGINAGSIQIQGSHLQVKDGGTLALAGGNVSMNSGQLLAPGGRIELAGVAGTGTVGLNIDGSNLRLSFPDEFSRTDVSLVNGAEVNVRAGGRGDITINARNIDISGQSKLRAGIASELGSPQSQAGDIQLDATGVVNVREDSFIADNSLGQGNAGTVKITAQDSVSFNGGASAAYSSITAGAVGNSGGIIINTGSLFLTNDAFLDASTNGQGNAGSVNINARDTVSLNRASIFNIVERGAVGNSGGINITTGSLFLTNGAQLQTIVSEASDIQPGGRGNAGNVNIIARDTVSFDGFNSDGYQSSAFSSVEFGGVGKGGDINITTRFFSASNSAGLIARMSGQGDGGSINIKAEQLSLSSNALLQGDLDIAGQGRGANINLDVKGTILLIGGETAQAGESTRITLGVLPGGIGSGGNLNIKAGSLVLKDGAIIKDSTQGQGNAGSIQINADVVDISGSVPSSGLPSGLFTSTDTNFQAGNIIVHTGTFRIAEGAVLSARSKGDGQGGNITVNATRLFEAVNGGQLVTTTFGQGQAGNIIVNATNRVTISGSDSDYINRIAKFPNPIDPFVANAITETGATSGLFANTQTNSTGQGGGIKITTGQLTIQDNAKVTVNSQGSGNAGSIEAKAASIHLSNGASFSADTTAGQGNINLRSRNLILRRGSSITTKARGSNITGGNITIDTDNLVAVPKENSDIRADSKDFRGGNVRINAKGLFGIQFQLAPTAESDITAKGASPELSGTVQINTPDIDLNSGLVNLPSVPIDTKLAQGCNSPNYAQSSFIITGRGGLPPNPKDILTPDAIQVDWVTLNPEIEKNSRANISTNPTITTPEPIVEATGWVINEKGQVVFTADAATTPRSSWNKPDGCRT
ncbi:MAG: filamentous hemagglutinin N-terminal domain-containing protein [Iphinoe sp. HA4291-MV1]|jgi:filamentous hemagglutinin family protein|nr:filamentous hemagglutinin N-terminal domain-containing protein [Iphinoe sp. HA4291-MV1]